MKLIFYCLLMIAQYSNATAQGVGIGTTSPHSKAILDLSSTNRVFLPPRMTDVQMRAIVLPPTGSMLYNTDLHQFMGYIKSHTTRNLITGIVSPVNKWIPISTGPKMLAWGLVDSFPNKKANSDNFSITWNAEDRWYELTLPNDKFYKDSMILTVTPVGNGSWDQTVSIGELVESTAQRATIKFTDVSRVANGWSIENSRRRSGFSFVLYDLRKIPF